MCNDCYRSIYWYVIYSIVYLQERMKKAESDIVNLDIPPELAYVYDKLDGM